MKRLESVSKIMTKKLVILTLKDNLFTAEKLSRNITFVIFQLLEKIILFDRVNRFG